MEPEKFKYRLILNSSSLVTLRSEEVDPNVIEFESEREDWPAHMQLVGINGMVKIPYQHLWIDTRVINRVERVG